MLVYGPSGMRSRSDDVPATVRSCDGVLEPMPTLLFASVANHAEPDVVRLVVDANVVKLDEAMSESVVFVSQRVEVVALVV